MIELTLSNVDGVIKVIDKSNLTETFTKAIVELPVLGLRKELSSASMPTLASFLSPSPITELDFEAKTDKLVTVQYTLLSPINNSGLSYNIGDNLVSKTGIFNLFSGTDYIFIDQLYEIDRDESTMDTLWLKKPIVDSASVVYVAYYLERFIVTLWDIPQRIKTITLEFDASCCQQTLEETLIKAHLYLESIKIIDTYNDYAKQERLLNKLKDVLGIC